MLLALLPLSQPSAQQESEPQSNAFILNASFEGVDAIGHYLDQGIAAGPTSVVLSNNGSVTIRDKTGTLVASTSLRDFFSLVRVPGENTVGDVRVVFDARDNRFFLVADGHKTDASCIVGTCVAHYLLAVSKTSSPKALGLDDWYFYALDRTLDVTPEGTRATTNWGDSDSLAVDDNAVVIASVMYSLKDNSPQGAKIRILDKSELIHGGPVTRWTDFAELKDPLTGQPFPFLQPLPTFDGSGAFFLASRSFPSNCEFAVVVWRLENPLTSPTLMNRIATAPGTSCNIAPDAAQPGGAPPLDTASAVLRSAAYRNSSIWTAATTTMNFGSGDVTAIRWVQINVGDWPNSI